MREALPVDWPSYKYHFDFFDITFYAKSALMDTWSKRVFLEFCICKKNLQNKNWKWWGSFCKKNKKVKKEFLLKFFQCWLLKQGSVRRAEEDIS